MTVTSQGKTELLLSSEDKEASVIKRQIVGLAVDKEDDVYCVIFEILYGRAVLCLLEKQYSRLKRISTLRFLSKLSEIRRKFVAMASDIVMALSLLDEQNVYICDNAGQIKYKFNWEPSRQNAQPGISISDKNEIMLTSFDAVYVHVEEGELALTIKPPDGHEVYGAIFHYVIHKFIVFCCVVEKDEELVYYLHCYSETGKLENSTFLCKNEGIPRFANAITSHPSGPVAVLGKESIIYI